MITSETRKPKTWQKVVGGLTFLIFASLFFAMCSDFNEYSENLPEEPVVKNNSLDGSVWQVSHFCKQAFEDYQPVEWSQVMRDTAKENLFVYHSFRAKSKIGLDVKSTYTFWLTEEGQVVEYELTE